MITIHIEPEDKAKHTGLVVLWGRSGSPLTRPDAAAIGVTR